MNFDYYQQYKEYSNIELLKIVKSPGDYQPTAIAVATQILSERQVTTEEIQFVDQYFHDLDNSTKAKKEKIDALKNKATDFLQPVLHPREKVEPNNWANLLLFVIGIQYTWSLFNTARRLISFLQCDYCRLDITFLAELVTLLYVPLIFFLLFKRKRWGWILLFADNLFSFISSVSQLYLFFKYQSIHHGDTTSFLLPILIKATFVFFLWRDPIANHFGISPETKKKTALITIAGTSLFIIITYLIFA
jgi:hypothetical protein